ncbi:MAG: phosphoribosylformylglycinamidine synthase subunit PurQ [Firmicutes bacterium]|nr:phosphoribosylformylglycinamidine synthase subunit PurQ [Candidatus Fermentithermobacillaceae bacterium]
MTVRFGVVVFPGSNCDSDVYHVIRDVLGQPVDYVWHEETDVSRYQCVVLPGGFSYGDYLRAGALARFSPVMRGIEEYAHEGGLVLGICNGFQILLESGLLPGAMLPNDCLEFRCGWVNLRVDNADTPFTLEYRRGEVVRMPIAHHEGNYVLEKESLEVLKNRGGITFTYVNESGQPSKAANPNGALLNIAGIVNERGNVLGMMPHPERCSERILGGEDGLRVFRSIVRYYS